MQYLLDTHSFLWYINADKNLSVTARKLILPVENGVFLSIVSLWEIAIKNSLGKLELKKNFNFLFDQIINNQIQLLNIEKDHLSILINLPFHHRDPFDRMIISQAINENLTIISKDPNFKSYNVNVIW